MGVSVILRDNAETKMKNHIYRQNPPAIWKKAQEKEYKKALSFLDPLFRPTRKSRMERAHPSLCVAKPQGKETGAESTRNFNSRNAPTLIARG